MSGFDTVVSNLIVDKNKWVVPDYEEDPSDELIEWLHNLTIEWEGDDAGLLFWNPGEDDPLLVTPGDTFAWIDELGKIVKVEL